LAGDKNHIAGAILAVVSVTLTTVEFYIEKIGNDKIKDTQSTIVKQLEKDIAKSKQTYEKIEKKIEESIESKNK
jgi:predicted ribosome quality control (RQC) complex YloA/Tae2 family protein